MRKPWLLAVLALPRLLRLLIPRAEFIDSSYMDGFVRVAHGQQPYRDFVHPQTPLPEYVLGGLERVLGSSHRVSEVVTALVTLAASWMVYELGRRRLSESAGTIAAVAFAWHPYLLLAHVFSREILVAAAALGCALAEPLWLVALVAAIGFGCKPTFALFVPALFLARPRAGIAAGVGCAALFGLCLAIFGRPFWLQAFVFHTMKGRPWGLGEYVRSLWEVVPILLPAALVSLAAVRDRLLAAWLAIEIAFYLFGSPTVWEHNMIELLPPAVLIAAAGAVWLWQRSRLASLVAVGVVGVAAIVLSARQAPRYWIGLDGLPRRDLAALAASLQGDVVLAPPEITAEAGKFALVHNPEIEGLVRAAEQAQAAGQLDDLLAQTRQLKFHELHERARVFWRPLVERALNQDQISTIILDDRATSNMVASLQTVRVSEVALQRHHFRPALRADHYTVFISCARPSPWCESHRVR